MPRKKKTLHYVILERNWDPKGLKKETFYYVLYCIEDI